MPDRSLGSLARRRRSLSIALCIGAHVALAAPMAAQPHAGVRGTVLDASSDGPIAGAVVALLDDGGTGAQAVDGARRCVTAATRGEAVAAAAAARTTLDGVYVLTPPHAGTYTLCVRALGYVPRALAVSVDDVSTTHVHVGLPAAPRQLAPVRVRRDADGTFRDGRGVGAPLDGGAALERRRQARDLTSDGRVLTLDDVRASAGLGELDVARAAQQLPGVSTRDDYSAAPWVRGAPSDQTTVLFDGLPMLGAYHAVGAASAVSADAIGDAEMHVGVVPTDVVGGAAGTLALRSRRVDTPGVHGALGASGIAAFGRLDAGTRDGRASATLTARRSYLDLTPGIATRIGADHGRLPYAFDDVAVRGDLTVAAWHVAASGLAARDRLWAPVAGLVDGGTGRWGTQVGQLTASRVVAGGTMHATLGASVAVAALRATADARLEPLGVGGDSSLYAVRETVFRPQPIDGRTSYRVASIAWAHDPEPDGTRRTALGLDVGTWHARLGTRGTWPHSSIFVDTLAERSAATVTTLWGERVWHPRAALVARTGARIEMGAASRNAPTVRVAPRVVARWAFTPTTALSAAVGATYQPAQTLAPPGPGRNAVATTDALWVIAGPDVPLLGSRIATLGVERWLAPWLLATATTYRRDDVGMLLADPRPGYLVDRPLAVEGRGRATGVEGALRLFTARVAGSASVAAAHATITAYGLRYASPGDRPWIARASGTARVLGRPDGDASLRVGLTWEREAGAPFTRYYGSVARCDAAQRCRWDPPPRVGPPSEERGGPTARLDATIATAWTMRSVAAESFVQFRNLTRAPNDAAYLATVGRCPVAAASASAGCQPELNPERTEDTRLPPLRGWLAVGVRFARRAP